MIYLLSAFLMLATPSVTETNRESIIAKLLLKHDLAILENQHNNLPTLKLWIEYKLKREFDDKEYRLFLESM